jgi:hypothetical protein
MKKMASLKTISLAFILLIGLSSQKGKKYYYSEDYVAPTTTESSG